MWQIITLVGTSVLTNGRRELKLKEPDAGQLLDYLRSTDETRGSAEINSLQHLLHKGDGIVFVHSDTAEGRLCTEVLVMRRERWNVHQRGPLVVYRRFSCHHARSWRRSSWTAPPGSDCRSGVPTGPSARLAEHGPIWVRS